ncbi:MAG: threonylcarbamoyl-AMP synthase [Flavobacteriales bacterium]|nr:threonylcarbamoyl-AMP synthase [Flavobacteriales bacterium]
MAEIGTDITKAAQLLRDGQLVGIPTETVYGLAANALDADAILRIFEAKGRPHFDPLIMHLPDADAVKAHVCDITPMALKLMDAFWPGPLTLVLPRQSHVPDIVTSGLDTVAVRVPSHPMTQALLRQLDFPLAAPSANLFGHVSPTTAQHVHDQLGDRIPYILDGGATTVGLESTIVGFEEGMPTIYRLGGLGVEEIERVIGPVHLMLNQSSDPKAPGMLKSHYAPRIPLHLGNPSVLLLQLEGKRIGFLGFNLPLRAMTMERQRILSPKGDMKEAAHNLFAYLREMETMDIDVIVAEEAPGMGLGKAINDRLRRASVQ